MSNSHIELAPATSVPVFASEAVPSGLDEILAQHNKGPGTIDQDMFFPPTPLELAIRGAWKNAQQIGARGVFDSVLARLPKAAVLSVSSTNEVGEEAAGQLPPSSEGLTKRVWSSTLGRLSMRGSKVVTPDEPEAPMAQPTVDFFNDVLRSPELFRLYADRYEDLLKESNRQRQDPAYREALAYWERRINVSTDQRERAECAAIRDRILGGVCSKLQIHELVMEGIEQYYEQGLPLRRLDDLAVTDALMKGYKLPDVPTDAVTTPQHPRLYRYHRTKMPWALAEDCSFIRRPRGARMSINFAAESQGSYQPGGTVTLSDYGTTILNDYQQAPSTAVLEPVVTRRLPYPFNETSQL